MEKNTIVIIGGGLIGQQWSMIFTASKYKVFVYDISSKIIEEAKIQIRQNLNRFQVENIARTIESDEDQFNRITFTSIFTELPNSVAYIMECVSENVEIKRNVFKILDSYFAEESIRMSSSSYIPISKFTNDLDNKEKCIIAHPVNPPYFLKFVEIVPALYTDRNTIDKVKNLMEEIGQVPIVLKKEVEGFALNRIQTAVYNSIFNMLKNEIISVTDVDKIMTEGLAPRWTFYGPMVVTAINGPGTENYFNKYLSSIDNLNEDQNYSPQHDEKTIERIVKEMNHYDSQMFEKMNQNRDSFLGKVLKIRKQHEEE